MCFLFLVYLPNFVLSTPFLCSSSRLLAVSLSSKYTQHDSSCRVSGTLGHLSLQLHFVLRVYVQLPKGGVGTHDCCNSVLLQYSVFCLRDSLHTWNGILTPIFSCLFCLLLLFIYYIWFVVSDMFQGPGWISPLSYGSPQVFHLFLHAPPPPSSVVIVSIGLCSNKS